VADARANELKSADAVTFRELRIDAAWNVRGNAQDEPFLADARGVLAPLPVLPMTSTRTAGASVLWLGPRSWLYVTSSRSADFEATRKAINAARGALFDVSASYVGWAVAGTEAAHVLTRECPLDLDPRAFPPGHCAQSLLGHVNALVYRPRDEPCYIVLVARSFGADAWHALTSAASTEGFRAEAPVEFLHA
jgi:sarcosine oxidase, subunit gamma